MDKKYLKDYKEPNYFAKSISLIFKVNENKNIEVTSLTKYEINPKVNINKLVLNGNAKLLSIKLNNVLLDIKNHNSILTLSQLPDKFQLEVQTVIYPWQNKSGNGVYASQNQIVSQCEPEGFREITYYQDRPDVLSIFDVTIIAENGKYNAMLSNGNIIYEQLQSIDNKEYKVIKWHDPFKKPSYLFALVVGNFSVINDFYITKSNKKVNLKIFSEADTIDSCYHAMSSLKKAMKWDEQRFNLEYDLNAFMIVATRDFNMGAMENKGLNIFNSKCVIANHKLSTDSDFETVEAVVAHEYFHNWTGNRVTCRDWFQLSLKEGLTVFRESQFCSDIGDKVVKRIDEVKYLYQFQFPEDGGPLSHSVRPNSYVDINNFYTVTVYEKGAEIIRMYQTILGVGGFNKGLTLYIDRHDGSAATCEDLCNAMADANNFDLSQFMLWYDQSGTPEVSVISNYDEINKHFIITFEQHNNSSDSYKPLLIPIKFGLIDTNGKNLIGIKPSKGLFLYREEELILLLNDHISHFVFTAISNKPTPSLLREFSAPIKLIHDLNIEEKYLIINHDNDMYNRYRYFQIILTEYIIKIYNDYDKNSHLFINDNIFWHCCYNILDNISFSEEYKAKIMTLPSFYEIAIQIKNVNPLQLNKAINFVKHTVANSLLDRWIENHNLCLSKKDEYNLVESGKRKLKNLSLMYIIESLQTKVDDKQTYEIIELILLGQYNNSSNMTDMLAVLNAVNNVNIDLRSNLFNDFYNKWNTNDLLMNKWFALQALCPFIQINSLHNLMNDNAFDFNNPNKLYSLFGSFTHNYTLFNSEEGYDFIVNQIIRIDSFNSNVSSGIAHEFNSVVYLNEKYKKLANDKLSKILSVKTISNALNEVVSKICTGLNFK